MAACAAAVAAWAVAAKAAPETFKVALSGAQQVPPVETPGSGTADLTYDPATRMLTWSISLSGLSGAGDDGAFSRTGGRRQERSGGDLAEQARAPRRQARSRAKPRLTPEQAQQFTGRRMVHQRAHPGASGRRDPRSGRAAEELIAAKRSLASASYGERAEAEQDAGAHGSRHARLRHGCRQHLPSGDHRRHQILPLGRRIDRGSPRGAARWPPTAHPKKSSARR